MHPFTAEQFCASFQHDTAKPDAVGELLLYQVIR